MYPRLEAISVSAPVASGAEASAKEEEAQQLLGLGYIDLTLMFICPLCVASSES